MGCDIVVSLPLVLWCINTYRGKKALQISKAGRSYYLAMSDSNTIDKQHTFETADNINALLKAREEKRDTEQFIRRIAPKYLGVYVLDKESDSFKDIVGPDYFRQILKEKEGCYSEALKIYIEKYIKEEDRHVIEEVLDYDRLYKNIMAGHTMSFIYNKTNGVTVKLEISRYSDGPDEKNLSLWIYTDESLQQKQLLKEQKQQKLLKEHEKQRDEQFAIFNALSSPYGNVFLINYNNETAKILKLNGYITTGLDKDSHKDFPYTTIAEQYISERVHPNDKEMMYEALSLSTVCEQLENDKEYFGNYRILENDEVHYYQFRYIKLANLDYFIVGFQNVDNIVENEKKQQEQLTIALAAAEQSSRAKTTFLNSMSHDIRTPMNAIVGFTALARTHIDNKELVQDYLAKINTSSNHLLSLINDILDMSRIESGSVKLDEKPLHIPDLLHDLRSIIQGLVNSKQQNLYIDTQDVHNEDIITDKLRLNQVLLNIVSNAIKFTHVGGDIIIQLSEKPCARKGYATYIFSIKDNGIGMSDNFIEHVFDTFAREHSSTVSGIQGTGLGMAITKNIVDMMGGTIDVESQEGKGSKFTVTLSFRISKQKVVYELMPELNGARALVIDDDINTCRSVCKMLRDINMRPDWTASGKEAILRAQDASELMDEYKVYIVDYQMPDMNGIETVRRIRKVIGDDVPIIVLTAYDWTDFEQEAREAGVTAFVAKPLFMSELKAVLTRPYDRSFDLADAPDKDVHDYSSKRVLLVEDNELNREIAVTILSETGMIIDTANDGIEAVNIIHQAPEDYYDLILMDIQMPRMDGYTATREIRTLKNNKKANIPIVAMTANAFEEDRRKAFETGMNGHIVKPIDMNSIADTLDKIFADKGKVL